MVLTTIFLRDLIKEARSILQQGEDKLYMKIQTLIELYDERPLENVLGVEVCRPDRVIYICAEGQAARKRMLQQLKDYFAHRGIQTKLYMVHADIYDTEKLVDQFRKLLEKYPQAVVDITGGTDAVLFAAGLACGETAVPVMTYSRKQNRFYNIRNADFAEELDCEISFSVEDTFLMAGGILRKGRVDNGILSGYLPIIDPFFALYLKHRTGWDRIVNWMQRASAADREGNYQLRVESAYTVKGERGTQLDAPEEVLRELEQIGMIDGLQILPQEKVCFQFADAQIRAWLRDVGSVLELYVYKACLDTALFEDVHTSAVVDWDVDGTIGKVSNELDVMCTRGIVPLFISCKTCAIRTEALNELAVLRDRFGGKIARAAIVSAEPAGASARNRAAELGIQVIDLAELQSGQLQSRIRQCVK